MRCWRSEPFLFLVGMLLFALLISLNSPLRWLSLIGLSLSSISVYRNVVRHGKPKDMWDSYSKKDELKYLLMSVALALGVGVGIAYRNALNMDVIPKSFTWFALVAAAIGATEEIIFRGVLVYLLNKVRPWGIVLITAGAHASYKTLLFVTKSNRPPIDLLHIFSYTFIAGLVLGLLRILSASTGPPLVSHVLWDVVVYGDSGEAPWWVW